MSDLTRIQQEILKRFQRPRTAVDDIPGYAGGNLGEQLYADDIVRQQRRPQMDYRSGIDDVTVLPSGKSEPNRGMPMGAFAPPQSQGSQIESPQQPTGQILTPQNQQAITRPRNVFAPPPETRPRFADPVDQARNESIQSFGSSGEPFTPTRERRTQPRDEVADSAQYLRDLENKPRNWKDKTVDVVRALNLGFGSNPNAFTPTSRERDILKAQGMLGRDIELQKAKTAQEMSQMVPIYDAVGNIIGTAPRKTAAGTQIRATDTTTRAAETKRRNDAYIADLDRRPQKEQAEAARKIYQSGVADGDEEFKATLAKRMGLTERLPDSTKGTVETDANGNFTIVNARTNTATTVTDKDTGKPKQSWVITREQRVDDRARRSQAAAMERAIVMAQATGARLGNPEDFDSIADEAQENADAATAKAQALSTSTKPSDKKLASDYLSEAGRHQAQAAKAREAASKARSGQSVGGAAKGRPRVDHAKFEQMYEAAKTPEERKKLLQQYQEALRIAGQ